MTTQHFEMAEATFGLSRGPSGELLIAASDPEQSGRTARFAVHGSEDTGRSIGFGPVFTMDVHRPTDLM